MAPTTEPLLGSVEPAIMGAVVWAAGAGAVIVTGLTAAVVVIVSGLAIAAVVVVAGLTIAVVVVVAGLTIAVVVVAAALLTAALDGVGVVAGSVPARRTVVVNVV
jgi:hypothetical protein